MDEAAAATTREDRAESKPCNEDTTSENNVSPSAEDTVEDTADSKYPVAVT